LFVVSYRFDQLGGHLLSTLTLARRMGAAGWRAGVLADFAADGLIKEIGETHLHLSTYPKGKRAFFSRPGVAARILDEHRYQGLVSMDNYAALQVYAAAARRRLPFVQVIAGGTGGLPPLRLPGIVVFSEELQRRLPAAFRTPREYITVCSGRVDFDFFTPKDGDADSDLGFHPSRRRVLAVSRLAHGKAAAIHALLDQAERAARRCDLQCLIIGEGEARGELETHAAAARARSAGRLDIRFLGGFRVQPGHLRQAELVVGQGRTVIEAVASGTAAAVCGNGGYYGLLTPETLPRLAASNLTGRGMEAHGSLAVDLARLQAEPQLSAAVLPAAYARYDASQGAQAIIAALQAQRASPLGRGRILSAGLRAWVETLGLRLAGRNGGG
jgi:hypothetical protein